MTLDSKPGNKEADRAASAEVRTYRYRAGAREEAADLLAIEEPLQIRLAGEDVAVTMRTPGHDEELAAGFLYAEGIVRGRHDIDAVSYCLSEAGDAEPNIINILPADRGLLAPHNWGRNFISSSSCGLCGKTSIEQVLRSQKAASRNGQLPDSDWTVSVETLYSLPGKLRAAQDTFSQTGGLHAAGLFTPHGDLVAMREDVGRHNAVDKIVGHALLNDLLPLSSYILLVSSRASYEIVQKALASGVRVMAVISAPSSLAVELALKGGMTLVGFLREQRLNVYSGEQRITT